MENKKLFDAVAGIDERFLDRCLAKEYPCKSEIKTTPVYHKIIFSRAGTIAASILLALSITLSVLVPLANKQNETTDDPGLRIGFDLTDDSFSGARLALATEKSKISLGEDLPVSLFCICGSEAEYQKIGKTPLTVTARIFMSYTGIDKDKAPETVFEIKDGKTPDYTWSGSFSSIKGEEMIVPAAAFTKGEGEDEPGVLVWGLEVNKAYPDGSARTDRDSIAVYYHVEEENVTLDPSEETLELARTAVERLKNSNLFNPYLYSHRATTQQVYEEAKHVIPELITLETKPDAAIALIKLYEEMMAEYRTCDFERFRAYLKEIYDDHPVKDDEIIKIFDLMGTHMALEALLALDCYYDTLDDKMRERMLRDFDESLEFKEENLIPVSGRFEWYRSGWVAR